MLLSHNKRFIFIHIYKTAGTSVMDVFLPYSRLIDKMIYGYKFTSKLAGGIVYLMGWHDDGMKQFTGIHKHATANDIMNKLGKELFSSYYKFAFVRNPYDLLVSLYFYFKQSKNHSLHHVFVNMEYIEFLKWHINQSPPNQVDFIMDARRESFIVDYVGRFETIQRDIKNIQKKLNLPLNKGLLHKNPSVHRKNNDYKEYYDNESIALVDGYFRKDLQLLGYSYEGFDKKFSI